MIQFSCPSQYDLVSNVQSKMQFLHCRFKTLKVFIFSRIWVGSGSGWSTFSVMPFIPELLLFYSFTLGVTSKKTMQLNSRKCNWRRGDQSKEVPYFLDYGCMSIYGLHPHKHVDPVGHTLPSSGRLHETAGKWDSLAFCLMSAW